MAWTFIRIILGAIVLFFLGMLYWSSLLIEENLKVLQIEIKELKAQQDSFRLDSQKLKKDLLEKIPCSAENEAAERSHVNSSYPNLLEKDPFYTTTLPKLLGSNFQIQGWRKENRLGRPEHLHPFNGFRDVSTLLNMCNVSVAQMQFGKYESMAPNMGIKMEARPIEGMPTAHEYWVHLRDGVFWQPLRQEHFPNGFELASHFFQRHPVTAYDFKFFFDAVMNPNVSEAKAVSLRNYFGDIEEFLVIDPLTFVVRWKTEPVYDFALGKEVPKVKYAARGLTGSLQPLPSFVFQYFADGKKIVEDDSDPDTYRTNSVWAQNFSHHFAKNVIPSCGPWIFEGMNEEGTKLKRNADYFEPLAVLVDGLSYRFKESYDGIWQDFKGGNTDLCMLPPSQLPELESFFNSHAYQKQQENNMAIKELDFVDQSYYYIGWNQASPFFKSKKVRLALTMAIDRNRIIEQNLNGMGVAITGPFYRFSPAYDPTIEAWPYDPQEARRLLEEEGWIDWDGDGIRDKIEGKRRIPFRFTLVYYAKNLSTKVICEYISMALKEVGVDCRLNGIDITDLSRTFEDKTFDAIYLGWSLGTPPEDPKQLWHSQGAKEKGSSNAVGFANEEADSLIEALQYEYDKKKRISLYHRFHKIIHEEVPYTFLYSPKTRLLYREYVQNLFIPRERQDLVPGADVSEPDFNIVWLRK